MTYRSVSSIRLLGGGQGVDADGDPLPGQVLHQGDETAAFLAEQVGRGHADVVEEQLRSVLGVHADLVQVAAALEAGHVPLDHQQADALVPLFRVGAGDDDHQVGQLAVGDEGLLPVEHVAAVGLAGRRGADALQVAAGARLGHRDRGDEVPAAVAGQPAVPLLRRAQAQQVLADHVVVHEEAEAGRARPAGLLVHDGVVAVVGVAAAAVLLVDVDAEQPGLPRLLPDAARYELVLFPLRVERRHLAGEELTDQVAEGLVLVGEDVASHAPTVGAANPPRVVGRGAGPSGAPVGRRPSLVSEGSADGPAWAGSIPSATCGNAGTATAGSSRLELDLPYIPLSRPTGLRFEWPG